MSNPWTLRYYREGDDEGILDLLVAAFGRWPGVDIDVPPIDHLRWKLGAAVMGRRYHIIVETGDRIIACGLVRAIHVKLRDEIVPACLYGDMAVDPEYQNRGIMGEVWGHQEAVGEVFALSIGVSDNSYVAKQYDKQDRSFPFANRTELLERATSPSIRAGASNKIAVVVASSFDERTDAFCAEALRPFEFAVARDREWLDYRYADTRAGRYAIRLALRGGRIAGYAVLTEARGKGFIADLLVEPGGDDVLDALLADASQHFAARAIVRVRCWLATRHPYRAAFERHDYRSLREVPMLKPGPFRDTDLRFLFDDPRAAVHYMAGDTDVV